MVCTHTQWNTTQPKKWIFAIWSNMDGFGGQYAERLEKEMATHSSSLA